MAKKKSNWDILRKQKPEDTLRNRDVYEDQQLERGSLEEKHTMKPKLILDGCATAAAFILVWLFVTLVQMFFSGNGEIEMSNAPEDVWIHVNAHYENEDGSQKISESEYDRLVEIHNSTDYSVPMEEPVPPEDPGLENYVFDRGGYTNQATGEWISAEDYDYISNEYYYQLDDYKNQLMDYSLYAKAEADPAEVYRHIPSHYRNRNELSEAVTEDEYNSICEDYAIKLSKGKISADDQDVPMKPYDPSVLYVPDVRGQRDVYGLDEEGNEVLLDTNGPLTYRHILDGEVISYVDYDEMVNKYNQDIEKYKEIYLNHRKLYHPDNVDNTKKIFAWTSVNAPKFFISFFVALIVFLVLYVILRKTLDAENLLADTSDINQYHNDQHVALPQEVQKDYDWFPDVGAHSAVQVSGMLSHMALLNKGLKRIEVAKRAEDDIKDSNGDIEYYQGEILLDDDGNPITTMQPMIDEKFMDDLFEASGLPDEKKYRVRFDATGIPYNGDGKNRDKLGKYDTVADMINDDWEFPIYEPQRPGGAYIVDTAPVNTMILAITRAGKGQTYIEPVLDMWMREKRLNNIVVNDPKGELLVKNYVRATVRGLQVVQFNLINAMKTDIYNPLAMAADAAREGDNVKCAAYVENIAEVFFPVDGADDPVWPNAANNAFKRAAYGLIDFYLEEEKAMRRLAERTNVDEKVLEQRIDEMWGKVTLYNCYQLFVQLSSKKMKNPSAEFAAKAKQGMFKDLPIEEYKAELEKVKNKSKLWEDKPEADLLTLYFAATDALPRNSMRNLVSNANNALKSMGGAEKMMASVYGIAITAMSFFTDPTISTLTSGTPNQNVDLGAISFPRRMGVRFHSEFLQRYHFVGLQCVWNAYEDKDFTKCLGKDFYHEDMVSREGWARYYFDGKFKNDKAYVKLEIKNPSTDILVRTFYFEFRKNYQTSLDGRVYVKDPILEERIVKNGVVTELRKFRKKDGTIVFRKGKTTFKQKKILDIANKGELREVNTNAIINTMCKYAEKPKMVFLVTPPHLMKYAKLILILIKQLVDLNFDKSYMTKSNQKPLYKTRFMLDELGNLQSEGHGISGFETMLSIGLGQEQQFTLILQTLQQLKSVYGDDVDKIVQGNAQPLDSKIATCSGWVDMGSIQIGDDVLTPHNGIAKVTGVFPRGVRKVYKIHRRDGAEVCACNEHLWKVYLSDEDMKKWDMLQQKA